MVRRWTHWWLGEGLDWLKWWMNKLADEEKADG